MVNSSVLSTEEGSQCGSAVGCFREYDLNKHSFKKTVIDSKHKIHDICGSAFHFADKAQVGSLSSILS
jgi:hypothetical protein